MSEGVRDGRTVLVTGAASGIGRAVALRAAAAGHQVIATDVAEDRLQELSLGEGALALPHDVTRAEDWTRVVEAATSRFGRLDVLVHAAGLSTAAPVCEMPAEAVDRLIATNLGATVLATTVAAAAMHGHGGHVVLLGSFASLAPVPGLAVYSATKHAVRAFGLAARQELAAHDVAVTVVCVDAVDTPMLRAQVANPHAAVVFATRKVLTPERVADRVVGRVLARRPAEVMLPGGRGWLMKLGGALPRLGAAGSRRFARQGARRQERLLS